MKIGIMGMGVVGSAVYNHFSQFVDHVYIYDADPTRSLSTIGELVSSSDFIFICVPTPSEHGKIDSTYVEAALAYIHVNCGHHARGIVIIKSTVAPGSTQTWINSYKNEFNIVHIPEFLTERTSLQDLSIPSRIVIGGEYEAIKKVELFYSGCFYKPQIICMGPTEAELVKYMSNCFFATKITFMNEMREIADAMKISELGWNNIITGFAASGRVARSHLDVPGPDGKRGYGGKCFPKDITALIGQAENIGVDPILLKAVQEKNRIIREETTSEETKEDCVT